MLYTLTFSIFFFFFFNDTATTEIYTLSLHDALPIPVLLQVAAPRFGDGSQHGSRGLQEASGVELLQPPSARPGDGTRLTVGSYSHHLGADQLDLLAGPLPLRTHPDVAFRGHGPQQVDQHPAETGVLARLAAFQRAGQQRRDRCAVLDSGRPRAAHQVRRDESFTLRVVSVDKLVVRVTHGRPAPGVSTAVTSSRDSFVPRSRRG